MKASTDKQKTFSSLVGIVAVAAFTMILAQLALFAQQAPPRKAPVRKPAPKAATTPAPAQPQWKGIWEPVNYSEDLQLTDIFCISVDVCYVSGAAGTILKTTDGGTTWNVQLGGNPESQEGAISHLRFIDEAHGWAYQDRLKLLRTTDGETWEEYGRLGDPVDYAFVSETVGVQMVGDYIYIAQTRDGGRTWEKVWPQCRLRMEIQGLVKNVSCRLKAFQFISPSVGFAVGATFEGNAFFVLKTQDGGETWAVLSVVPDVTPQNEAYFRQHIFFIDDTVGFVALSSGKFFATTDGGQSWRAVVATVKGQMKFADPEVGWALGEYNQMPSYTTDGGKRWASTQGRFPASVKGLSLPRRDRAYVVGDHGMIYRYRVVPATEEVAKNVIVAPAMPGFVSPLDEEVEDLGEEVETLETELTEAAQAAGVEPGAAPAETPAEEEPEAGGEEEEEEATAPVTGWAKDCCGAKIQKLQTVLEAVSTEIPRFTGKYRNLNLMFSGLQTVGQFFGQAQGVKDSLRALRKARDPQSALSALTELTSQVQSLKATTKTAFQKQE